ncbi:MAG: hypothetical protein J7J91_09345, partial [Deltaproteobacteria bacterium]|nr:hypothetical protein [Deltaproteobacteria bacterium]
YYDSYWRRKTMIVVDANIISYLYLPTSFSVKVDTLFKIDPDWSAPFLWRSEFRNVLALYLRKGLINFDNALGAYGGQVFV